MRCCSLPHLRSFLPFYAAPSGTARCSEAVNNSHFPVDLRGFWCFWQVDLPICALTQYYAFGTMLRRKRGSQIMPIGEFGGAPPLAAEGSPALTTPMYWMYELAHASLNPGPAVTHATKILFPNPLNPGTHTQFSKSIAASFEFFA